MGLRSIAWGVLFFNVAAAVFLLAALALAPRRTRATHRPLMASILVLAYATIAILSHPLGFWSELPGILSIPSPEFFLFAPGIYLYLVKLLAPSQPLGWKRLIHFAPALACLVALWPILTADLDVRRGYFETSLFSRRWFVGAALLICSTGYLFAAWKRIQRHRTQAREVRASLERFRFGRLEALVGVLGLSWLILLVLFIARSGLPGSAIGISVIGSLLPALLIFGLRRAAIFGELSEELNELRKPEPPPKYATSGLSREEASMLARKMRAYLEHSQCYLDSSLKLEKLAQALRITVYQASQVINMGMGENFFSLVNHYRIEEAKRRLLQASNGNGRNILGIAYDVGFNSKSTFNTAFRKRVGMTPSEFRASYGAPEKHERAAPTGRRE